MAKPNSRFDILSIIIGVLISLAAQGVIDAIFYYATGKILEELVAIIIAFMIIALTITIALSWALLRAIKKTDSHKSSTQNEEVKQGEKKNEAKTNKEEKERAKLIYEIVTKRYDREWQRTKDLDSKASGVTGFAGILATLIVGISKVIPQVKYDWLLITAVVLLVISAFLGVCAYWTKSYFDINPNSFIEKYKDKEETEILMRFTGTTSQNTMFNDKANREKVIFIELAFAFLVLAISLFLIFSILNLMP